MRVTDEDELLGQRAFVTCRLGAGEQRRAVVKEQPREGDSQRRSRRTGDDRPYAVSNTQLAAADPNTAVP
jgi:hypothetical protein